MPTQPFIPVTWKNVTGPSNYSANNLLSKSGEALGSAIEGLGTNIDQFADDKQKRETDEFIAELNALGSDEERNQLLAQADTGWKNLDRINTAITDAQKQDFKIAEREEAALQSADLHEKAKQSLFIEKQKDIRAGTEEARAKEKFEEIQKGYPFAADKRERTAKEEELSHETKLRTEADRNEVNNIVSTSTSAAELNERGQEFLKKGGIDKAGQFKKYANQAVATTPSEITEDTIYANTGVVKGQRDTHSRANYNKIIQNEYLRLKKDNPLADDALLRQKAHDAVKRTSAITMFERQEWYEKLTDPASWKVAEQARVKGIAAESLSLLKEANKSQNASLNDPTKRGKFKEDLLALTIHARNNPDSVKPAVLQQINNLTAKGIRDVVAQDFDPTTSYQEFIHMNDPIRDVDDPNSELYDPFAAPKQRRELTIEDFSPTNRQMFMEQQTEIIQRDFPDASEALIQQKLSDKIQKSPLGVLYVTGGHKAALKAARERFTVENRMKEMKYRTDLEGKFIEGGGKGKNIAAGAAKHTFNEVFARINPHLKLTSKETNKLRNQIDTVYTKWNSYFVKDNLNKQQRISVNIAIHEILQGIELDRDDTSNMFTMWLDETDITVAGIDRFDDAKNIKKNQALTAILAHIDTGKRPNITQYLQNKILAEIPKTAIEERKAMKKRIKDAQTGVGVNEDGETLLESLTK